VTFDWTPLIQVPIEWGALALFVMACLFWERSGFSGLGVEGSIAAAVLGLYLGCEWTGDYGTAIAIAAAAAILFALLAGTILHMTRVDAALGAFALGLVPAGAVALAARAGVPSLLRGSPPPGIVPGTVFEGTALESLVASPWMWATPVLIGLGAWLLWHTPFGLRLRAFGENPGWRAPGSRPTAYRLTALAIGSLWTVPGAALLVRAHPDAPPYALGYVALACAIAGRWTVVGGVLLALGPALLRSAKPYVADMPGWSIALDAAPFLLAAIYLLFLSRRSLRMWAQPQARADADVL